MRNSITKTGLGTRPAKHHLHLMEVVVSIALLAVVMTGAFSGLHANRSFRRKLILRSQAILAIDNALERASMLPAPTVSVVHDILLEEMEAAGLNHIRGLQATCKPEEDSVNVQVGLGENSTLAQVRIRLK